MSNYFNEQIIKDSICDDQEIINEIKSVYRESLSLQVGEIRKILETKALLEDVETMHRLYVISHTIKGSAASVGDETLRNLGQEICDSIKTNTITLSKINNLVDILEEAYNSL